MEFLSSGFQQLYSDLENDFLMWDYSESGIDIISKSDLYEPCNLQSDNNDNYEITTLLTSDYGKTFEPFQNDFDTNNSEYFDYSNQISESDWEHAFLENYLELPDVVDLLPERTPLCNESCDMFLKESSENLNKFRPERACPKKPHSSNQSDLEQDKVFPCTYGTCKKVYAKPAHLKAHIRRHLGDKPYVCTWPNCTWKFSRSDELARHRRSHSGIKPYSCTYCSKCFSRSDHLAKHKKVHERKMAACKQKGIILTNLPLIRPGRKPKNSCDI